MTTEPTIQRTTTRQLRGIVTSDRMDKTVLVKVSRLKTDPKYKKRYSVSTTYAAHDPENAFHVGDAVIIREGRPRSKTKRWEVVRKEE